MRSCGILEEFLQCSGIHAKNFHKFPETSKGSSLQNVVASGYFRTSYFCQTYACTVRDHPFKTSACLRGGGVKNWPNLPTDST